MLMFIEAKSKYILQTQTCIHGLLILTTKKSMQQNNSCWRVSTLVTRVVTALCAATGSLNLSVSLDVAFAPPVSGICTSEGEE